MDGHLDLVNVRAQRFDCSVYGLHSSLPLAGESMYLTVNITLYKLLNLIVIHWIWFITPMPPSKKKTFLHDIFIYLILPPPISPIIFVTSSLTWE